MRSVANEEAGFMAGIYPLLEIPTGDESKGLGNVDTQAFLPLWLQKAWGPWQMYGGGGYWINPGEGHRDFWFSGWQVQREINKNITLMLPISSPSGLKNKRLKLRSIDVSRCWMPEAAKSRFRFSSSFPALFPA